MDVMAVYHVVLREGLRPSVVGGVTDKAIQATVRANLLIRMTISVTPFPSVRQRFCKGISYTVSMVYGKALGEDTF